MLDEKIGFDIGWDYWAFGLLLPSRLSKYELDLASKGFSAAKDRKVRQAASDRFVRKWLQLRINAWRRKRVFDLAVTPEFIRYIDSGECPVTEMRLTHSTGEVSDWSVDRINNNAGYSPGNLIVVSSLANKNKSDFAYDDIRGFALCDDVMLPGGVDGMRALTRNEWMRWASICSNVVILPNDKIGFDVFPCVAQTAKGIPMNVSAGLQLAIALFASEVDSAPLNAILAGIQKNRRRQLRDVVSRARKLSRSSPSLHGLWFCKRLYGEFFVFYKSLANEDRLAIKNAVIRTMCRKNKFLLDVERWAAGSDGYSCCGRNT